MCQKRLFYTLKSCCLPELIDWMDSWSVSTENPYARPIPNWLPVLLRDYSVVGYLDSKLRSALKLAGWPWASLSFSAPSSSQDYCGDTVEGKRTMYALLSSQQEETKMGRGSNVFSRILFSHCVPLLCIPIRLQNHSCLALFLKINVTLTGTSQRAVSWEHPPNVRREWPNMKFPIGKQVHLTHLYKKAEKMIV